MGQGGMARQARGLRVWVAMGLSVWAAGCATEPLRPPTVVPLAGESTGDEAAAGPRWTVEVSAQLREVHIYAMPDCVFVDAEVGKRTPAVRRVACVDAQSGAWRWTSEQVVTQREPGLWLTPTVVAFKDGRTLHALGRADGVERWSFTDAAGRPLYDAFTQGDGLVVNVGNAEVVVLDGPTGAVRRRLDADGRALVEVVDRPEGAELILRRVTPGEPARGELQAVPLGEDGGASAVRWTVPIERWDEPVTKVGPALIGAFATGEIWAVASGSGEVLWRLKRSGFGGDLVYSAQRLIVAESRAEPTMAGVEGHVLRLRGIDPAVAPDRDRIWSFEVPTEFDLLGVEGGEEPTVLFGATYDRFFVFDEARGALTWSYHISDRAELGLWSTASSNGEAVFAFFDRQGAGPGLLQRIPIVLER